MSTSSSISNWFKFNQDRFFLLFPLYPGVFTLLIYKLLHHFSLLLWVSLKYDGWSCELIGVILFSLLLGLYLIAIIAFFLGRPNWYITALKASDIDLVLSLYAIVFLLSGDGSADLDIQLVFYYLSSVGILEPYFGFCHWKVYRKLKLHLQLNPHHHKTHTNELIEMMTLRIFSSKT